MATPAPAAVPEPPRALPATEVLVGRIGWLIHLRWLGIAGTFLFVELGGRTLPLQIERGAVHPLLAALAAYNALMWLGMRRVQHRDREHARNTDGSSDQPGRIAAFLLPRASMGARHYDRSAGHAAGFALAQIVLDLCFLAALLHVTGGLENPLWVFFVFHVIIASVLLSRSATYAVAALGTALLWTMVLAEQAGWLPRYPLDVLGRADWYADVRVLGLHLAAQAFTLFVAAYLASSIAGRLRRREADVVVLSHHLAERARALEQACEELSAAERAKSQYLRKVSHELRAPLGTIKTALTLVLDAADGGMSPQLRRVLERAERRTGELVYMTRALLSLARAQGAQTVRELGPVSLPALLEQMLEEVDARAAAASLRLRLELPPALPVVLADGEGLADLLANLLGNAIRYTPAGGSVWLRVASEEEGVVFEVRDTGIGIAPADRARIFEEFYRSAAAREHSPDGSGLGLAIVRAVVDEHGGTIEVESEAGKGTAFRVTMPLRILPQAWQPVSAGG